MIKVNRSKPLLEGAGVKVHRAFGFRDVERLDPFLMLDDFHSEEPKDYMAGFPLHPHRGIETVTYMIKGQVEHRDNIGNQGVIGSGDVQWMTAGSGIMHEEMPRRTEGLMQGFQLWVNLPRAHKMMPPRYREVKREEIPVIEPRIGVEVKVIAGQVEGVLRTGQGPGGKGALPRRGARARATMGIGRASGPVHLRLCVPGQRLVRQQQRTVRPGTSGDVR